MCRQELLDKKNGYRDVDTKTALFKSWLNSWIHVP